MYNEDTKNLKDRKATEERILEATKNSIKEAGWQKLTISMVAREANVSRRIIRKYFGNIEGLIGAFIDKHDFWFRQRENLKQPAFNVRSREEVKAFVKELFTDLFNYFNKSDAMRSIMLEELNSKSRFFASIHNARQDVVNTVNDIAAPFFKGSNTSIRAVVVKNIGSTYHLFLRAYKNGSVSGGIDIMDPKGRQEMLDEMYDTLDYKFSKCPRFIK